MNSLSSLIGPIGVNKIFNYFNYFIDVKTSTYNVYGNKLKSYLVFYAPGEEHISIFALDSFSIITKTELLCRLSNYQPLPALLDLIDELKIFTPKDQNIDLTNVPVKDLLTNYLALLPITSSKIFSTVQFTRRVFTKENGYLAIPLFTHSPDRKFTKLVNLLEWDSAQYRFLNSRAECLNTSAALPDNKFILLTCSPHLLEQVCLTKHAPDYFFFLIHSEAPPFIFETIVHKFHSGHFQKMFCPISDDQRANMLTLGFFSFLLTVKYSTIQFSFSLTQLAFTFGLRSANTKENVLRFGQLFNSLYSFLDREFYAGSDAKLNIEEDILNLYNLTYNREENDLVLSYKGKVFNDKVMVTRVIKFFIHEFDMDKDIEILTL